MTISHLLQPFEQQSQSETDAETDRDLQTFETGYTAGWEDCLNAQSTAAAALDEAFAQNLRELSFTYHEAFAEIATSAAPLFSELIGVVFTEIAEETLCQSIAQEIERIARQELEPTFTVACHASKTSYLKDFLAKNTDLPINLLPDDALAPEEVQLRLGHTEKEVADHALITKVQSLVRSHFSQVQQEAPHG